MFPGRGLAGIESERAFQPSLSPFAQKSVAAERSLHQPRLLHRLKKQLLYARRDFLGRACEGEEARRGAGLHRGRKIWLGVVDFIVLAIGVVRRVGEGRIGNLHHGDGDAARFQHVAHAWVHRADQHGLARGRRIGRHVRPIPGRVT